MTPEEVVSAAPWASEPRPDAAQPDVAQTEPASATSTPPGSHRPTNRLTRRERDVATLVARGLTDRQIAEELVITEGTVGVHLNNIFTKLDLHARAQLAVWAAEHGLLQNL
jgi:DNA-binding NarL/FixJ family response regulator